MGRMLLSKYTFFWTLQFLDYLKLALYVVFGMYQNFLNCGIARNMRKLGQDGLEADEAKQRSI